MDIGSFVCGSCAVGDMRSIGSHNSAKEVMAIFCKSQLGMNKNRYGAVPYQSLIAFYIFCAGPEVRSDEKGGNHHSKDHWVRYGSELADYLVLNGLGVVVTAGQKENIKHHVGFTCQLWIFSPDQKACERWWDTYQATHNIDDLPLVTLQTRR